MSTNPWPPTRPAMCPYCQRHHHPDRNCADYMIPSCGPCDVCGTDTWPWDGKGGRWCRTCKRAYLKVAL